MYFFFVIIGKEGDGVKGGKVIEVGVVRRWVGGKLVCLISKVDKD